MWESVEEKKLLVKKQEEYENNQKMLAYKGKQLVKVFSIISVSLTIVFVLGVFILQIEGFRFRSLIHASIELICIYQVNLGKKGIRYFYSFWLISMAIIFAIIAVFCKDTPELINIVIMIICIFQSITKFVFAMLLIYSKKIIAFCDIKYKKYNY